MYYHVHVLCSIVRFCFFTLKYLCVCVYTLCVAGAYMCKVMDRVMVGEGQSYPASCVNCHKTQTIYEKSIGGLRDLRSCKWGWIYFIIQISVTITDTVAHNYNTKFIEISIDHLHIYKVFMAWQIDLQRCMCIHCNRTHTFFRMDRQFLVIGKFRIHTCVCVCMYIHTFWKLEKRKSLLNYHVILI